MIDTIHICIAMKPIEGNFASNALEHGVAGLNVDGCRVATGDTICQSGELVDIDRGKCAEGYDRPNATMFRTGKPKERGGPANTQGRWPANLIHDGSDEVVGLFPVTNTKPGSPVRNNKNKPYGSERTWSASETGAQQTAGYTDRQRGPVFSDM